MRIGEKIKELRKLRGIGQKELAQKIGCSPIVISKWEIGAREPRPAWRRKLADFFGVSEGDLFGGSARIKEPEANYGNSLKVPIVSRASASSERGYIEFEPIEREYLEFKSCKAVEITSNSMAPLVYRGQKIIYSEAEIPKDGDLVFVKLQNGEQLFKRLHRNKQKKIVILESINIVDKEKPIMVDEEEIEWMRKVIGVRF